MFKKIIIITYIVLSFNFNSFADENQKSLKIGLLAPFSGEYKDMGQSIMLSLQLALDEIKDDNIKIFPRDSGFNNEEKLIQSIESLREEDIKIVIGPISHEDFYSALNYKDMIFISPSNINPKVQSNILSVGISLESQIKSIEEFIKKKKRKKTIIMYPKNKYTNLIDSKIENLNINNKKIFKYSADPKVLTSDIEKLTNYKQRKRNLISRVKILEEKDDEASKLELKRLEQKYTIGKVNFDSVIISDFDESLKSVITSLLYTDISPKKKIIITFNQWFDKSLQNEKAIQPIYYPSINKKNLEDFEIKFIKEFNESPNYLSLLTYDLVGLVYYLSLKNDFKNSVSLFKNKNSFKGKIGIFDIKDNKINHRLNFYKVENGKLKKIF